MIAFLGMGLLGSNFTKALLRKGERVKVWNRTTARAEALAADGAVVCASLSDAVSNCERIHLTLKDDEAVNEVLQAAAAHISTGTVIIDHTTTSVDGAKERTTHWASKGITYLHAPVFMGPQNALESTGSMLVSGNQEIAQKYTPVLQTMTGKVINYGEETGRAAAMKLVGNLFLVGMTAALSDALALAKSAGASLQDVNTLFDSWNPAAMLPARMKKITSNTFDQPTWELNMSRKDVRLMMNEVAKTNTPLAAIPGIAATMDKFIAAGFGQYDWTVIAKDNI